MKRIALSLLLLCGALSAQTFAPWPVGPVGEGGLGLMAWRDDGALFGGFALPLPVEDRDGDDAWGLPFWRFQAGAPLFGGLLRPELLWSRHRHDERRLQIFSADAERPARERNLLRFEERGARLRLFPLKRVELGVLADEVVAEGSWQSCGKRGWTRMLESPAVSEWLVGVWAQWAWEAPRPDSVLWTQWASFVRANGFSSRDREGLLEGWEWQLVGGWTITPARRLNLSMDAQAVFPHWRAREYRIAGNDRLLFEKARDPRARIMLRADFVAKESPRFALLAGPGARLRAENDTLSYVKAEANVRAHFAIPRLVPFVIAGKVSVDPGAAAENERWDLAVALFLPLPGGSARWSHNPEPAIGVETGWADDPVAAPEARF